MSWIKKMAIKFCKTPNISLQKISSVSSNFGIICIDDIDFIGRSIRSPNDKYLLCWSDKDQKNNVSGFRNQGNGRVLVINGDRLLLVNDDIQRPNEGKIANNGTFIIHDWMFGDKIQGTFYAIDIKNNVLIKHYFRANLGENAISDDGSYAICSLMCSDNDDSCTVAFFDLKNRKILWQKRIPTGSHVYRFEINHDKEQIVAYYFDRNNDLIINFRYTFDGDLIDKKKWEFFRRDKASSFEIFSEAERRYKETEEISLEKASEIINLLKLALEKGDFERYPRYKAKIFRILGEIAERFNKVDEAIKYYQKAIDIYPKVGVKKKLYNLQKKLQ